MKILDYIIGCVALGAFLLLIVENTPFGDTHAALFQQLNLGILLLFAADVLLRLTISKDRKAHLRKKWLDLIVFVPLIQFLPGVRGASFFIVIRQFVIGVVLLSRSRKASKLLALLSLKPGQLMTASFLFAVGAGTVLLMLPAATVSGARTSWTDALFTATSAVCVTGLAVQDTATHFSRIGQLIILALIQAGGLGIMTFSVSMAVFLRRPMDVKQRAALQDMLDYGSLAGIQRLVRFIFIMTLSVELCGAALLFTCWMGRFDGLGITAYHALFHAVSAFCNAGFSTFSDSLVQFRGDVATNIVVAALIVIGGIGFMAVRDLLGLHAGRNRVGRRIGRLRVQTRVVIGVSLLLLVLGTVAFYVTEGRHQFADMSVGEAWMASAFQSVTMRTAGFNTCNIGALSGATILVAVVLMFIGASPGSTGGGVKTTTVAVLVAAVVSVFRNRDRTELGRRTIPHDVVLKALSLLCISIGIVFVFALLLLQVEQKPFRDILFETVSAFGTVGLSTGITPHLTPAGKVIVTVLMFIGRLGPLTIAYVFVRTRLAARYQFAEERVMIG